MKRRLLMVAAPAAVALWLTGCSQQQGDELIGYWSHRRRAGGRIVAMLEIQRDGRNLAITIAEFPFSGQNTPRETAYPLVYSRDIGQFGIQSELGLLPVVAVDGGAALSYDGARFERSTKEEYIGFLATELPDRRF